MMIPVVEGQSLNSGVRVVTGAMAVKDLLERVAVPYRDALKQTGYQRRPQDTRVNKFAAELRAGGTDVPTSILLNLRKDSNFRLEEENGEHMFLNLGGGKGAVNPLYVVDGQHRILAFGKLCEENKEKWGDYKLQIVLMLGATEREEVNQFYVVNTTAKSVKTDLALDLLKQRADSDGRIMEGAVARGYEWKIEGQSIVNDLFKSSIIWREKIQLANAEKGNAIIPAASFVTSLKTPLTNSPIFKKLKHEQRVKIIDVYWLGIRSTLRKPFDGEANHYALQKGIGVTAMHEILPIVIEIIRSAGDSVFDADAYKTVMSDVLMELSGDNVDGENVSGADFWLTAPRGGAAGSFSSSAGKRVLFAKLRSLLPEMKIE